ncbi:MAG: hypothetical protein LUE64_04780 [Candidatus Gastranaerophilales bacterium]|nr:hypothetical protein [Candidatus Gastranaerophilales bacterium]
MKVSAVQDYNCSPNFKGVDAGSILSKASNINSWQQRAALGVAAIALQPMIDLHNKKVDEETRKVSAARSFSKALVGMTTGVIVRGGSMKVIEGAFKNEAFTNKFAKYTASDKTKEAIEKSKDFIKNQGGAKRYAAVMGTIAGLGIMMITNFAVDAPLTNWLTNKITKGQGDTPNAPKGDN